MPAELESMFYQGEVPWHGLGVPVDRALTAEEAITTAGLNWDVELVNLFHNYKGNRVMVEGRSGIRRSTDGKILGIMSPQFKPVQNREAFGFFDSVVGTGEAKYHTAGSLRGGQRVWMMAKLDKNGPMNIRGDAVDKYLLLMNGHDGGLALKMFFTPIRVVCMNTLTTAVANAKRLETFRAVHFGNVSAKINQAREILGMTVRFFDNFQEQALRLATLQLPAPEFPKLLCAAFGTAGAIRPEDVVQISDFATERQEKELVHVQALFEGQGKGLDNPAIKGTRWAAYNAIVEYCDFCKTFRGDNAINNRLEYIWFWGGQRTKQRAWNYLLMELIND